MSFALPPCVFHKLTGLWCPGCGTGRALKAIFTEGDFLTALKMNPLLVVGLPILLAVALFRPAWLRRPAVGWALVSLVIAYWVLRNLPWWPFTLLAPV